MPDLVKSDLLPPEGYRKFPNPILVRNTKKYWQVTLDGNPKIASAEKGKHYANATIQYLVELIDKINKFQPN